MKLRWLGRLCALLLCGILTLSVPGLAAESKKQSEPEPNPAYDITWETLEDRVMGGSLSALALLENAQSIESINYDRMEEQLRSQLNTLADAQWFMVMLGQGDSNSANSMAQAYTSLRETFDAIRDGEMQKDNADTVRQIRDGAQQVVLATQTLYINLLSMEQSAQDGSRGLATLDRNLEELRLRHKLGQVSAQTVREVEQTRAGTVSQLATLDTALQTYKSRLQTLIGETPTGKLSLGPLPAPTREQLDALDYEADLTAAKAASWKLYSAKLTLDDAKEDWLDARKDSTYSYQREMADHVWQSAQITYQSTLQEFELTFSTLNRTLSDNRQVLTQKQADLAYQEGQLEIVQARYRLGRVSKSAVANAEDSVASARSAVETAQRDLFTAWNNYQNAVQYGLLPA